jgi:cyclophilin family peptidyl-prolyl cis-trans isomerase
MIAHMTRAPSSQRALGLTLLLLAAASVTDAQSAQTQRPRLADERILLRTTMGDVVLALYPDVAPRHVQQLLELVRLGVYDTSWFFRVDPRFVIQLADAQNRSTPITPRQASAIAKLPLESSELRHRAGVLSMARHDHDENSAETSFSVLLIDAPHLDGKYTIFGEIEHGWPVVEAIARVQTDAHNKPLIQVSISRAAVVRASRLREMLRRDELRGPTEQDHGMPGNVTPTWITTSTIAMMMLCGFVVHFRARHSSPKVLSAFGLLTAMIGGFWLFASYAPNAKASPTVGLLTFLGILALIRVMNRFESAAPPAKHESPQAK